MKIAPTFPHLLCRVPGWTLDEMIRFITLVFWYNNARVWHISVLFNLNGAEIESGVIVVVIIDRRDDATDN